MYPAYEMIAFKCVENTCKRNFKISTLVRMIYAFLFSEVVNILVGHVQYEQLKHIFCC